MRLINVDKLVNDIAEHITVKAVSRVLAIIQGQPTVKAIPYGFISEYSRRPISNADYWAIIRMVTAWEEENEAN